MEIIPAMLVIVVALLVIAVPIGLFIMAVRALSNASTRRRMPEYTARVKVLDKSMSIYRDGGSLYGKYPTLPSTYTTYYVTFETEQGQRLTFGVGADTASTMVVGDVGQVRFKGDEFLSFQHELPGPHDYHVSDGVHYRNPNQPER